MRAIWIVVLVSIQCQNALCLSQGNDHFIAIQSVPRQNCGERRVFKAPSSNVKSCLKLTWNGTDFTIPTVLFDGQGTEVEVGATKESKVGLKLFHFRHESFPPLPETSSLHACYANSLFKLAPRFRRPREDAGIISQGLYAFSRQNMSEPLAQAFCDDLEGTLFRHFGVKSVEKRRARRSAATSAARWEVKVMVVADQSMTEYYSEDDDLVLYVLALMNGVRKIFRCVL